MFKITTLNKISNTGLSVLPKDCFEISDSMDAPDGIILRSFSMHETELPASLLAVARAGAGVNNVPIDRCSEAGVVVFNTPGANANAVKELVVAGLLLSSRKIVNGINWVSTLEGQAEVAKLVEKGKGEFVGPEITGKTLGVVGLGAIGALVANAANALGMNVIGYDPFLSVDGAWNIDPCVKRTASLGEIYEKCDYISLHLPVNAETKKMFNADILNSCKAGVRVLNFARGELVDNAAMKAALESGQVSCYVTDFPDETVVNVKNIVTIPHLGASTPESEENCAYMASVQLKNYLEQGNIKNSVNFAECQLPFAGDKRVCVISKADVASELTSALPAVKGMISKSKGNNFYTIVDVDKNASVDANALKAIANVVNVRVI